MHFPWIRFNVFRTVKEVDAFFRMEQILNARKLEAVLCYLENRGLKPYAGLRMDRMPVARMRAWREAMRGADR